jgi:hypothetical protein
VEVVVDSDLHRHRATALEPLDPETAVELYLEDRRSELAKVTQYAHSSRLGHSIRWCDEQDIDNLNELTELPELRVVYPSDGDEQVRIDEDGVFGTEFVTLYRRLMRPDRTKLAVRSTDRALGQPREPGGERR